MPFKIIRNDITKMNTDAIVNAVNTKLQQGGGVCGAIFAAAGAEKLQKECDRLGDCKVGQAVITSGYNLLAKHIIHTVGPIWQGGNHDEADLLRSAYTSALNLALQNNIKSIAFPLISSGIYGYPKDQALKIAISTIQEFLNQHEMDISLVVYEKDAVLLSEKLFSKIEKYIDEHYIKEDKSRRLEIYDLDEMLEIQEVQEVQISEDIVYESSARRPLFSQAAPKQKRTLEDVIDQIEETFSQRLLGLIDEKGMTDVEAYKGANVDRRLFSKIRSKEGYNPSKITAIAFAISLKLNLDETKDLLARAGYVLSPSSEFDLIIRYFIEEGNHDIYAINEALFDFDQKLLGA